MFSYHISKRLFYAIQGALDHQGKWFLSWVVNHPWHAPKTLTQAQMHWLVAEYALRWDDPAYFEEYKHYFVSSELTYVHGLARLHKRQKLMDWFDVSGVDPHFLKRKADTDLPRDPGDVKTARVDGE